MAPLEHGVSLPPLAQNANFISGKEIKTFTLVCSSHVMDTAINCFILFTSGFRLLLSSGTF